MSNQQMRVFLVQAGRDVFFQNGTSGRPRRSFSIDRWGCLVSLEQDDDWPGNEPSLHQLQLAVSMMMPHWRDLLGLPPMNLIKHFTFGKREADLNFIFSNARIVNASAKIPSYYSTCQAAGADKIFLQVYLQIPQESGITVWELNKIAR